MFTRIVPEAGESATHDMKTDLKGTRAVTPAELITLTGKASKATNTIYQHSSIGPGQDAGENKLANFPHSLQPFSINVLELSY